MQEAPATSKAKRWLNLALADLGLLRQGDISGLQTAEKLALKIRHQKNLRKSKATQVVFLLPLVRKSHVSSWSTVEANLANTIDCFINQTDPNWIIIICGQDKPNLTKDDRIHFLPYKRATTGNDKWAKLSELVSFFPKISQPSGYVMTFDADDLAHRNLVQIFLSLQNPNGYLIDNGIVYDTAADTFGQAGRPTLTKPLCKPFWKLCGSCAAFRYDSNEKILLTDFIRATSQHEHRMFPYLASLAGRPLSVLKKNLVIYKINHGENFDPRLNKGRFKIHFVRRFPITDSNELQEIRKNFC